MVAEAESAEQQEHDGHAEGNADEVVEVIGEERIGQVGFEEPAVGGVEAEAEEEEGVGEVAEVHGSVC
ncbi:MAG: hypothetical protein CMJ49_03545 [Planctomycetaceae bacterium]|nr:hypothetical protein [Planctomycetaceae bacterium]